MKIAIAQLNYHVGNIKSNTEKIINTVEQAKKLHLDLVVFSELAITGYPPLDLLEQQAFIEDVQKAVNDICIHTKDIAVIVGAPCINEAEEGKKLFNSAIVIENQEVKNIVHKTLLPTYDIFDEYRYFEPNQVPEVIEIKNTSIALTICEDLWDTQPVDQPFAQSRLYHNAPMKKLAAQRPEIIINIAASPFSYNQEHKRKEILIRNAHQYQIPLVYVNQVGANTEIVFDGASKILNRDGEIIAQLESFEEDFYVINTAHINKLAPVEKVRFNRIGAIHDAIILGVRDYFRKMGFEKAVLGLSGGIDSALVSAIACLALGKENVHNILMPSQFSSDHSISDSERLCKAFGMSYDIIPIENIYTSMTASLNPLFKDLPFNVAEENIQARTRGVLLMAYSNKFGHMLLNTSNKSEAAVGYSTLYGDMNGGLSVLGDVYKTDIYELAKYINKGKEMIPENIITKPPSAELRPDQKDTDSLPDYDILDKILFEYIELKQPYESIVDLGFNKKIVKKVIDLVNKSEYKRFQFPPILRVSSKAFGFGRRFPIVAHYG